MDVALFVTCLADTFYPRVGQAAVRLLQRVGRRVVFPAEQTCCGQPFYNSGFHAEAAGLCRRLATALAGPLPVVTPSASCKALVCEHAPHLLPQEPAVQDLAARTRELLTFLCDACGMDIAAHLRIDEPVTFHYPCHARGTYGVADLQQWLGRCDLRVPEPADLCCGFGGAFAVDLPELSGAMLDDKLAALARTGAELVICNEPACMLQMAGGAHRRGLPLRFKHLAECLAESLGLLEPAA